MRHGRLIKTAALLLLATLPLTSCRTAATPKPGKQPSQGNPAVFVETLFAAVPRVSFAEVAMDPTQLPRRPDVTVFSGGGALLELRDGFAYVPSLGDPAPSRDLLETGARNLRIGLRPRLGGDFDVRLESLPSFEGSIDKTVVLEQEGAGVLLDTQLARDGRVLAVFVRAYPVNGRADLERIHARKLAERNAARDARGGSAATEPSGISR
jgi:hypothetical protein